MKYKNKTRDKFIKFLNGKAFYVVLCICFMGVGVAAWSGVQSLKAVDELRKPSPNITENQSPTTEDTTSETEPEVPENKEENKGTETKKPPKNQDEKAEETGAEAEFFVSPVVGKILKDYSDTELQFSMTYGDMRLHKGIDIAAAVGTPVTAAGNGKVTAVENDAFYGTVVEIDHGNGIIVRYSGLNATPTVKVGDIVDSSVQIGTVDVVPCESVEERHLHLEFLLNGKHQSPLKYINE